MSENVGSSVTLPFSLFRKGVYTNSKVEKATITFHPGTSDFQIQSKKFKVQDGILLHEKGPNLIVSQTAQLDNNGQSVPLFSIVALVLLILLRNLFYTSFQKYFLSINNKYEIDFNIQKIGFLPLLISFVFILFAVSNLLNPTNSNLISDGYSILNQLRIGTELIFLPILVASIFFFLLNFSYRLFPIIFSDLKTMFGISLIVLVWNFLVFGSEAENFISTKNFILFISILFLIVRSILLLNVFKRAYRFRLPITLFYICALNLGTFLFFYNGFWVDILRHL